MGQYDLLKHEKHLLLRCQYNDIDFQKYLDLERLGWLTSLRTSILSPCWALIVFVVQHGVTAQMSLEILQTSS
jgi:hypothetical protein